MEADGPRYQPEFSPGERLAHIEAIMADVQRQLDRRFTDAEKLHDQKLWGLGERLAAISNAQKEAVNKSEEATQRTLSAITEGIERSRKETSESQDRYRREIAKRIEGLEQGQSAGAGARHAANEYKATSLVVVGIVATLLSGGLVALIINVAGG